MITRTVIPAGGGDYATLSAAEAGMNGSMTDDIEFICSAGLDTSLLTWAGWTSNGFQIYVRAASGAGFDGAFTTTGKYVLAPTANALTGVNHANTTTLTVTYENITIRRMAGNSAGFRIAIMANSGVNTIQLDGCYVETGGTAVTNMMAVNVADAATRILKARNTVFVCPSTSGEGVCQSEALALMYLNNCVIDGKAGAGAGVARITSGTCEVRNCVVFNTSDDFLGTITIDSCASDDGDGTNAVTLGSSTEWNACLTDYANGDYTIKDASAPIYNTGADLSADANYAVTTDVIGTARPQGAAWDIGISELVVGGGGAVHDASVAFSGAGTAAYNATRLLAASVAYSGAGTTAFNATRLLAVSVTYSGAASTAFNATRLLAASASFTGAATFAASPIAIRVASFAAQGVATFAANGEIVPSGPQTHLGSVAFAGAGQFSASPIVIRAASVAYVGAGTFSGNPVAILQAAAQFTGAGYFAAAGEIFDPANIRATLIRGMRDIRSSSGMGSVRTRAELGAIETTASISEVN